MALYTKESIERVKEAADLVALVEERVDLRRVGGRHMGLCPFHDERTPSFSVRQDFFHCFGCGESGDVIGWVEKMEGLDFPEAVELLAERAGVELRREKEDPQGEERRRRRDRLLGVLERATVFYERYLWDAAEADPARRYLAGRGLSEEVLRAFRIGFSPRAGDKVLQGAQRDGYSAQELAAAGLARSVKGGVRDAFRGRIMFPLAGKTGRVLGFGARAMGDEQPKYLNTAENEVYKKGRQLFGIDRARTAAGRAGRVVAVEGYTDVLALHQAGIGEAVAVMGTALTQEQLKEMANAARPSSGERATVFLALDADRAGQEAMLRAARMAEDREVELRVVAMPEGTDPADLVASEGADAFTALLESALLVPEFAVRRTVAAADLSSAYGRDRALEAVRPLIEVIPRRSATRDELVRFVADRLDVPEGYVTTQLASAPPETSQGERATASLAAAPSARPAGPTIEAMSAESAFLAMCVAEGAEGRAHLERLTDEHLSSEEVRRAAAWLRQHFEEPLAELPEDEDPAFAALVTQIVMRGQEEPSSTAALRMGILQLEQRKVERALRLAEREGDFETQRELQAARQDVRRRMDAEMGQQA